jgi:steroid Delta-isomerase
MVSVAEVSRILQTLEASNEAALSQLEALYHPEVEFIDPIQKLRGRDAFVAMNRKLFGNAKLVRFEVHHAAETEGAMFLSWTMHYAKSVGPTLRFEGVTQLELRDGLIARHRDYWDLIEGALSFAPQIGSVYRKLASAFL